MENQPQGLSLFDYIGIILKHRKFILSVVGIVIVFILLKGIFKSKNYEVEADVWGSDPLFSLQMMQSAPVLDDLIKELNLQSSFKIRDKSVLRMKLLSIFSFKQDGNTIIIRTQTQNPDLALNLMNKLIDLTIARHKEFVTSISENEFKERRELFEREFAIAREAQKELIKDAKGTNYSVSLGLPSFPPGRNIYFSPAFYVISNAYLTVSKSHALEILKPTIFGGLIVLIFAVIAAFIAEYFLSYKTEWQALKQKYF